MNKTNEDYLHLLQGNSDQEWDQIMIDRIKADIMRMAKDYTWRQQDDYSYHSIKAGINNILEHYELSNGIHNSLFELHEAWDEGSYYLHLDIMPRPKLETIQVNIKL